MLYGWDAGSLCTSLITDSALTGSIGVIGGILANPHFLNDIGNPTDSRYITFIAAGILLGDVVGLAVIAPLSWRLGRRRTIILCCWIAIVGVILQTATHSPIEILVGRVVLGIANGREWSHSGLVRFWLTLRSTGGNHAYLSPRGQRYAQKEDLRYHGDGIMGNRKYICCNMVRLFHAQGSYSGSLESCTCNASVFSDHVTDPCIRMP